MPTYTAPTTRAAGYVPTAAVWNSEIVENIKYFKADPTVNSLTVTTSVTVVTVTAQGVAVGTVSTLS